MSTLDQELQAYRALAQLLRSAKTMSERDPGDRRVVELGLTVRGRPARKREELAEAFDAVDAALAEAFLLRLVASFEATAFQKLATAIGEARTTLDASFPERKPYRRSAAHLLRDASDFDLKTLASMLRSHPGAPAEALEELREHRNKVAHGGRIGKTSTFSNPTDVHRVLTELLASITDDE